MGIREEGSDSNTGMGWKRWKVKDDTEAKNQRGKLTKDGHDMA